MACSKSAFGRGDVFGLARIGLDRRAQALSHRFERRLGDVVAVDPMQRIDMKRDAAVGREGLEELADKFGVKTANPGGRHGDVPDQIGPGAEIKRGPHQGVIHRQQARAVAADTALVAQSLGQSLTKGDAGVFDRVVVVDVQVAGGTHFHVDQRMAGQLIQHVVKKFDAGLIVIGTSAVEVDLDSDIGFRGFSRDLGAAHLAGSVLHGALIGAHRRGRKRKLAFGGSVLCSCTGAAQLCRRACTWRCEGHGDASGQAAGACPSRPGVTLVNVLVTRNKMSAATILVVDDDPQIREVLSVALDREGFRTVTARDGAEGLARAQSARPDLMVLDIGLPEMDGLALCRAIRADSDLPILFLTARDDEVDRILGLEMGGDDYVTKPFSPRELVARVRAILKRTMVVPDAPKVLSRGRLSLAAEAHDARVDGAPVALTATEISILAKLMARPSQVFSRPALVDAIWGPGMMVSDRTLDSHLRNLRAKLVEVGMDDAIETLHGVGLRMGPCGG